MGMSGAGAGALNVSNAADIAGGPRVSKGIAARIAGLGDLDPSKMMPGRGYVPPEKSAADIEARMKAQMEKTLNKPTGPKKGKKGKKNKKLLVDEVEDAGPGAAILAKVYILYFDK